MEEIDVEGGFVFEGGGVEDVDGVVVFVEVGAAGDLEIAGENGGGVLGEEGCGEEEGDGNGEGAEVFRDGHHDSLCRLGGGKRLPCRNRLILMGGATAPSGSRLSWGCGGLGEWF